MHTEKLREAKVIIALIISKLPFIYFTYRRIKTHYFHDLIPVLNLFNQDRGDLFIYMHPEVDRNIKWILLFLSFRSYIPRRRIKINFNTKQEEAKLHVQI